MKYSNLVGKALDTFIEKDQEKYPFFEYDGCSVLPLAWQCDYHRKKKKKLPDNITEDVAV